MSIRILAIGDTVGESGVSMIRRKLPHLRKQVNADFVVVNGENAAFLGLYPEQADTIFRAGADVITLGNHSFGRRELLPLLDREPRILRPANWSPELPGKGVGVFDTSFGQVAVISLIGRCGMDYTPDNPFLLADKLLERIQANYILIDFHAEATSEKLAMGYMLDGKISALWGTHTHVPTADNQVLPKGTGYVTDLGMTGPRISVLGVRPELSIQKFRGNFLNRYQVASGPCKLEGALFTLDESTGRCESADRVMIYD